MRAGVPVGDDLLSRDLLVNRVVLVVTALLAIACGEPARITGRVVDNFGAPVGGASVHVVNTAFRATTSASGDFSLEFVPGTVTIAIDGPVVETTREVSIAQLVAYPMGDVTTVRLPSDRGVQIAQPTSYAQIEGTIVRTINDSAGTLAGPPRVPRTVSVNRIDTTRLPSIRGSSVIAFLDMDADDDWLLVEPAGSFLTIRCEATIWAERQRVRCPDLFGTAGARNRTADATWSRVADDRVMVEAELTAGHYCFVHGRDTRVTATSRTIWMEPLPPGTLDEVRGDHAYCFGWNLPTAAGAVADPPVEAPSATGSARHGTPDRRYGIEEGPAP